MGYPTRVQLIRRKASEQWYVNFPAVLGIVGKEQLLPCCVQSLAWHELERPPTIAIPTHDRRFAE